LVKWYEAGILSQQPGFDSRLVKKTQEIIKKLPNDREFQGVFKKQKKLAKISFVFP